jgi:hypothetical protein
MALHYAPYTRNELDAIISRQTIEQEAWADDSLTYGMNDAEAIDSEFDDNDDESFSPENDFDNFVYVNVYTTVTNILVRSHYVATEDAEAMAEALRETYPPAAFKIDIEN